MAQCSVEAEITVRQSAHRLLAMRNGRAYMTYKRTRKRLINGYSGSAYFIAQLFSYMRTICLSVYVCIPRTVYSLSVLSGNDVCYRYAAVFENAYFFRI